MSATHEHTKPAVDLELIIGQLDSLPTLDPVAVRLLELTTADDSDAADIIEIITADPALASRVLRLCQCDDRGRAAGVTTVDRAVVMLGFDAVRSATLAVQVFGTLEGVQSRAGELPPANPVFSRGMFWRHCLAVAIVAEELAKTSGAPVASGEAFIAGLLHDLGHLVLHVLLPRTFDRVCELAESRGVSVDRAARSVMELDTHAIGKRLAVRWGLPAPLVDVIWLSGVPVDGLPSGAARELVSVVTLADAVVRRQHIAGPGHGPRGESIPELAAAAGIEPGVLDSIVPRLHGAVASRAAALGIDTAPGDDILLRSIARANEVLERRHRALRGRLERAERQGEVFDAVNSFWDASADLQSLEEVLAGVAYSAGRILDGALLGLLCKTGPDQPWRLLECADGGPPRWLDFGPVKSLADIWLVDDQPVPASLRDRLGELARGGGARLLPVHQEPEATVVVLYAPASGKGPLGEILRPLRRSWSAAIGATSRWLGMRSLSEELAQSGRELAEARDEAARTRALAAVGEIAAGAAHELNNPLAIIAGRSQLLADRADDPDVQSTAQLIARQAARLSDMVTGLREFADPQPPQVRPVRPAELVAMAVEKAAQILPAPIEPLREGMATAPVAACDPEQISGVLAELLCNAREADPRCEITVSVHAGPFDDRLRVEVTDTGPGLSEQALAHAFDPFFSEKPAGRRPGMGLALARRVIESHGGTLSLRNGSSEGAVATVWLPVATTAAGDEGSADHDTVRGEDILDGTHDGQPQRPAARRSA